jgi:hypothetical protein
MNKSKRYANLLSTSAFVSSEITRETNEQR